MTARTRLAHSVARTHFIEYEWADHRPNKPMHNTGKFDILVSSAEYALLQFHRAMQRAKELDADRQVKRPKLRHDQYRITRLYAVHQNAVSGRDIGLVTDEYLVPTSANPDVTPHPGKGQATVTMPFYDEVKGKREEVAL